MFPPQLDRVTDMDALQEWKALKRIYVISPCKWNAASLEMRIGQVDYDTIHPHLQTRLIIPAAMGLAQLLATEMEELKEISPDRQSCPSQQDISTSHCLQPKYDL